MTFYWRACAALLVLFGCAALTRPGWGIEPGASDAKADSRRVEQTFDQQPFEYQSILAERKNGFRIFRLTYPSPVKSSVEANNTVPADYYLPNGTEEGPPRPAVIVLHILNGNFELERLLCTSLATRGIPALMFKLPYYGERSLPGGRAELAKRPDLFAAALPQGILDARRTIDVLASRPEIDPKKIGVTGISLGGIVSATTAGADPRVNRAVLLLAGGDLMGIIGHAREGKFVFDFLSAQPPAERAKYEALINSVDPLAHAADLRERAKAGRVLMLNAREDDVIPPTCTNKLAEALGIKDQVVWFDGLGHYTAIAALPQTFKRTVDFFAQDLPASVKPPVAESPPPGSAGQTLATIAQDVLKMATTEPSSGRCHLIDLSAELTDKSGKRYEGQLRLVRGSDYRFRIEYNVPVPPIGTGMWGQDSGPWMATGKAVFRSGKEEQPTNPLKYADPKYVAKFSTLAAGFGGLLLLPGVLDQSLDIQDDIRNGERAILIGLKEKRRGEGTIRLEVNAEGRPAKATFQIAGAQGAVTFRAWQVNTVAPEELFRPPAVREQRNVAGADLYRIFGATFDFLMELTP